MKKIVVVAFVLASCFGCKSKVDKAYDLCVEKQNAKLEKQAENGPPQLKETLAKEGHKLSEAACGPIKTMCAADAKSVMCTQMIESMTK